jgi:hypothetical protein
MQSMTDGTATPEFKKFSESVLALGVTHCRNTEVEFHFCGVSEEIMKKVVDLAKEAGYELDPEEFSRGYVEMYDSIYRSVCGNKCEGDSNLWNFSIFDGGEE